MRALVLAGGGMRGAYTSGVVDALQGMGQRFDAVYGTSSGGGNGAWFTAGQTDVCCRSWDYAQDPRILSYRRWLMRRGPLLDLDALLYDVYPNELGFDVEKVRKAAHGTFVATTDIATGRTRFFDLRRTPVLRALRATSAIPLATGGPVEIDGRWYLDGGLTTPFPLAKAISDGARDILVVLNKPDGLRRPEPRAASWFFGRQYPALALAARHHHHIINDTIQLTRSPPAGVTVQVLRPDRDLGVTRFTRDLDRIRDSIDAGRSDAYRLLN